MSYWKIAAYSVASAAAGGAIGALAVHCVRSYCNSSDRTSGGSLSFTAALQATDFPASSGVDPAPMEDDAPPASGGSGLAASATQDTPRAAVTARRQRSDVVDEALSGDSPRSKASDQSPEANRLAATDLGAFDAGRGSRYIDDVSGGDDAYQNGESPRPLRPHQCGSSTHETQPKAVQLVAAGAAIVSAIAAAAAAAAGQGDASLSPCAAATPPILRNGREIVAATIVAPLAGDCDAPNDGGSASCASGTKSPLPPPLPDAFLKPPIERRQAWCSKDEDRAPTRLDNREADEPDADGWPATVSPPPSPSSQCSGASAAEESAIFGRCRSESGDGLCAAAPAAAAQQLALPSKQDNKRCITTGAPASAATADEQQRSGASAEEVTLATTAAGRATSTLRSAARPADWAMRSRRPQAAGDAADGRTLGASVDTDLDRLQSATARDYIASIEAVEAVAAADAADSSHSISGENRRNRGGTYSTGSSCDSSSGTAAASSGASNGTNASFGGGGGDDASEGADWESPQRPEEEEEEELVEDCPEESQSSYSYTRDELALAIGTSIGRGLMSVPDDLWQHIQDCGIGRPPEELPSWSSHKIDPNRKRDDQPRRNRRNAAAAAAAASSAATSTAAAAAAAGEDWLDGTEVNDAASAEPTASSYAAPYEVAAIKSKQTAMGKQAFGGDEWRGGGGPAPPAAPEPAARGRLQQRVGGFFAPEYEYEYAKLVDDLLEADVEYPPRPTAASAFSTAAALRGPPLRQSEIAAEAASDFRAYGDDEPDAGRFIAVEGSTNYYKIELSDAGYRAAALAPAPTAPIATSSEVARTSNSYYWQTAADNNSYRLMLSGEPASVAPAVGFCGGSGSSIGGCSVLGDVEDEVDAAYPAHHAPRTGSTRGGGRALGADDQQDAKRWNKQNGVGNRNRRPRRSQGETPVPPTNGAGRASIRHKMDPASSLYKEAQAAAVAAVAKHVAWDPSVRTDDDDDVGWGSVGRNRGGASTKHAGYRY